MCILITALPSNVAPKNVQNGTKKWPHVIPAKSNNGFGIYFENNIGEIDEYFDMAKMDTSHKKKEIVKVISIMVIS